MKTVNEIIVEQMQCDASRVTDDALLSDLGMDEMDVLELEVRIREEMGVVVFLEEFLPLTVREVQQRV